MATNTECYKGFMLLKFEPYNDVSSLLCDKHNKFEFPALYFATSCITAQLRILFWKNSNCAREVLKYEDTSLYTNVFNILRPLLKTMWVSYDQYFHDLQSDQNHFLEKESWSLHDIFSGLRKMPVLNFLEPVCKEGGEK